MGVPCRRDFVLVIMFALVTYSGVVPVSSYNFASQERIRRGQEDWERYVVDRVCPWAKCIVCEGLSPKGCPSPRGFAKLKPEVKQDEWDTCYGFDSGNDVPDDRCKDGPKEDECVCFDEETQSLYRGKLEKYPKTAVRRICGPCPSKPTTTPATIRMTARPESTTSIPTTTVLATVTTLISATDPVTTRDKLSTTIHDSAGHTTITSTMTTAALEPTDEGGINMHVWIPVVLAAVLILTVVALFALYRISRKKTNVQIESRRQADGYSVVPNRASQLVQLNSSRFTPTDGNGRIHYSEPNSNFVNSRSIPNPTAATNNDMAVCCEWNNPHVTVSADYDPLSDERRTPIGCEEVQSSSGGYEIVSGLSVIARAGGGPPLALKRSNKRSVIEAIRTRIPRYAKVNKRKLTPSGIEYEIVDPNVSDDEITRPGFSRGVLADLETVNGAASPYEVANIAPSSNVPSTPAMYSQVNLVTRFQPSATGNHGEEDNEYNHIPTNCVEHSGEYSVLQRGNVERGINQSRSDQPNKLVLENKYNVLGDTLL